jgi:hypothetical protein
MFDKNAESGGRRRSRVRIAFAAAALLLAPTVLVACGEDGDAAASSMTVSVVEPARDAKIGLPFTVKIDAGVPLGPTESGKHHVHLWFDDNANDYLVVESETAEVKGGLTATLSGKPMPLPPGEHVIHVSLRNANHSPAGADTEIPVQIAAGGAPTTAPAEPETSTEDPYDY